MTEDLKNIAINKKPKIITNEDGSQTLDGFLVDNNIIYGLPKHYGALGHATIDHYIKNIRNNIIIPQYVEKANNVNDYIASSEEKTEKPEISSDEIKFGFFKTEDDWFNKAKEFTLNHVKLNYPDQFIVKKYTSKQILEILTNVVDIKYVEIFDDFGSPIYNFYIRDFKTGIYFRIDVTASKPPILLGKLILAVIDVLKFNVVNKSTFIKDVLITLNMAIFSQLGITKLNQAPAYLQYHTNGIFNINKKERYDIGSDKFNDIMKNYSFVYQHPFDHKFIHELADDELKYHNIWEDFIKSICFIKDDNSILYFKQDLLSTYLGDGKKKYKIQIGSGANGKSTWDSVHQIIASKKNTVICKINEFSDDNKVNKMSLATKFTYGDDLNESSYLSGTDIERLKTLITGQSISVGKKYSDDVIVQNKGNYHQNVNEYPKNLIDNDAIRRRFIVVPFTKDNFSKSDDPIVIARGKAITDYIGEGESGKINYKAITALIAIISEIDNFTNYTLPTGSEDGLDELLNGSDNIMQAFINLKFDGIFETPYIPSNVLAKSINNLIKEDNPSVKESSTRTISSRLKPKLLDLGYIELSNKSRITEIDKNEFSIITWDDYLGESFNKRNQSTIFYNKNLLFKDNYSIDFMKTKSYNECSFREKMIVDLEIFNGNTEASEYKSL